MSLSLGTELATNVQPEAVLIDSRLLTKFQQIRHRRQCYYRRRLICVNSYRISTKTGRSISWKSVYFNQ